MAILSYRFFLSHFFTYSLAFCSTFIYLILWCKLMFICLVWRTHIASRYVRVRLTVCPEIRPSRCTGKIIKTSANGFHAASMPLLAFRTIHGAHRYITYGTPRRSNLLPNVIRLLTYPTLLNAVRWYKKLQFLPWQVDAKLSVQYILLNGLADMYVSVWYTLLRVSHLLSLANTDWEKIVCVS